jgi:hypothetical protein
MKLSKISYGILAGVGLLVVTRLLIYATANPDEEAFAKLFRERYQIFSLGAPDHLDLAGEKVPLADPQVYESFDRELLTNTYWQSNSLLMFKRAHRYFPTIEKILKQEGVPDDFKYLAVVESNLANVVSPAGAAGFWQLVPETARELGLQVDEQVDERYHLEKSTRAAAKYLKKSYRDLGSWTMAAAAYNMGPGGLSRQMKRQQAGNFYDLSLNSETARYVYRILAVKTIMENPEDFGFRVKASHMYRSIPVKTVDIDSSVASLGGLANTLGINYRILKYHNPWLRESYLKNPEGKKYVVTLPVRDFELTPDMEGILPEVNDTANAPDSTQSR